MQGFFGRDELHEDVVRNNSNIVIRNMLLTNDFFLNHSYTVAVLMSSSAMMAIVFRLPLNATETLTVWTNQMSSTVVSFKVKYNYVESICKKK